MTPQTVRDLAVMDLEYRAVAGSWPERPGRDPVLHAAVREAAETLAPNMATSGDERRE